MIEYDAIFGCIRIISFQLTERIKTFEKSVKTAIVSAEKNRDMYGLAYPALRGRHDDCIKPHPFRKNPFGIYHKAAKLIRSGCGEFKIFLKIKKRVHEGVGDCLNA